MRSKKKEAELTLLTDKHWGLIWPSLSTWPEWP